MLTALRRDLVEHLDGFNLDRAHNGRSTKGRVPGDIVLGPQDGDGEMSPS